MSLLSSIGSLFGAASPIVGVAAGGPMGLVAGSLAGAAWSQLGSQAAANDNLKLSQQLWLQQQEYNSPQNQVQRLTDAGLNPNMMLSSISSGTAQTAPSMEGYTALQSQGLQNSYSQFQQHMQARLLTAQVQSAEADALYKSNMAYYTAGALTGNTLQDTLTKKGQNILLHSSATNQDSQAAYTDELAYHQKLQNFWYQQTGGWMSELQVKQLAASIKNIQADTSLKGAQKQAALASATQSFASAHNLDVSASQINQMLPYLVNGAQLDNANKRLQNHWQETTNNYNDWNYGNRESDRYNNLFQNWLRAGAQGLSAGSDTYYKAKH